MHSQFPVQPGISACRLAPGILGIARFGLREDSLTLARRTFEKLLPVVDTGIVDGNSPRR
jgi:hypothetical protein